ncbi:hypothetical protein BH09ACT10_BH09ACT10_26060 [soil metagenome]
MDEYDEVIAELAEMAERIRALRKLTCTPPAAYDNARYHGYTLAISGLNKAIKDMRSVESESVH